MRIDKLLWFLRLCKTRSAAQALVNEGHVRLDGKRVERPAQAVAIGNVLVLPHGGGVLAIEIFEIPARRGPATEVQQCYRVLDERGANPIAASNNNAS
jgi:ribosome-associated heat shock protein Hsp15